MPHIFFKPSFNWILLPAGIDPNDLGKEFKTKPATQCGCIYTSPNGACNSCSYYYGAISDCAGGCENNTPKLEEQCVNCQKGHRYYVRLSKSYSLTKNISTVISKIKLPRVIMCRSADDSP